MANAAFIHGLERLSRALNDTVEMLTADQITRATDYDALVKTVRSDEYQTTASHETKKADRAELGRLTDEAHDLKRVANRLREVKMLADQLTVKHRTR